MRRNTWKKLAASAAAALLAAGLLAGCGGGSASDAGTAAQSAASSAASGTKTDSKSETKTETKSESAASGETTAVKTLVIGDTTFNPENAEPNINPHEDYAGWPCIRYGVGETLIHYSDSMEIEPWLAKSWENVDELTWKLTLQDGVTFHSGRKMDAEAVKECLEHLIENHDRAPGDLMIDSIEADGMELTITTTEPRPALLNYLGDPYGCIFDVQAGVNDGIVAGTGPYIAIECESGDHITLVKNEDYWNGTPKIDELTIRTISDGDTLAKALQSGEIQAAYGMAYESYPLFENANYTFSQIATSRAFFLWMNYESPIASDPAVRKAIAMGINKEGFVKTLLNGNGYPGRGVFPDTFSFGGSNVDTETYDPEGAKAVLEKAGWVDTDGDGIREKDGQKLTIRWLTYPSRQELPLLAESAQATLKDIGIGVDINSTADHNKIRKEPDQWDVYASAMVTAPTGDPEYFFTSCCLDSSAVNNGHFHSDTLEELEKQMAVEFDPDKRSDLAIDMQQAILDDNGYVFCSFLQMSQISKANVTGYIAHACDYYQVTADLDIQ